MRRFRKPRDPERSRDLPHAWIARHVERIRKWLIYEATDIAGWEYKRAVLIGPNEYQYIDEEWQEIKVGQLWGGFDLTFFFKTQIEISPAYKGSSCCLDIDLDGGETQIIINGKPWQGVDHYRSLVPLHNLADEEDILDISMEAFVVNYPYDDRRNDRRDYHTFERARIAKYDRIVEDFLVDIDFALEAYLDYWKLDAHREIEDYLLNHLEECCRILGPEVKDRKDLHEKVTVAHAYLRKMFHGSGLFKRDGQIAVCSHSHLDIIYLWPIKETFRKCCRTVTNMLNLMREFPGFQFSFSQPYLYEKLKEMHPDVYSEVQQRVQEGRWEVVGAMYVEPDCNLLGAESFVRQILYGKKFILDEFGIDSRICWLPDVFGALNTIPQILKKSGIDFCLTAKLSIWNDTNVFPYDSFRWRGLDGSEVITHFPPTHFGQEFSHRHLRRHWRDFREKGVSPESIFVYGLADGGGGPTRAMASVGERLKDFPGLPQLKSDTAESFFNRLRGNSHLLPVWDDELYLEAHRGTLTTRSRLKRLNRKYEILYRDAEIIGSIAHCFGAENSRITLETGWKLLLLHQFHDTLPGTHIVEAIPDIESDYEKVQEIGTLCLRKAMNFITERISQQADSYVVFNTLSWRRASLIQIEGGSDDVTHIQRGEQRFVVQHFRDKMWSWLGECSSLGWDLVTLQRGGQVSEESVLVWQPESNTFDTKYYQITLGEAGELTSLFDKNAHRQVLAESGNRFELYEDDPGDKFCAWDIAFHLEEYRYPIETLEPWKIVCNGPVFAVFSTKLKALSSVIEQEMWIYKESRRIDFKTRVDWRERKKLLKVSFPCALRTRHATYEVPFGIIERATHRNTSWDKAKFEVCGHKWADISEPAYGMALLNDCKYGYDAKEGTLRMTLLRSPSKPNPTSDTGVHEFTYSIFPHSGDWRVAGVDRQGYDLNIPLHVVACSSNESSQQTASKLPRQYSFVEFDKDSVIVEALKIAEDDNGLILRSFDSRGTRFLTDASLAAEVTGINEVDLLERPLPGMDGTQALDFESYEIKSHRLSISLAERAVESKV